MANLSFRPESTFGSRIPEFDPMQTVRDMLRWDPFVDLYRGLPIERASLTFNPQFDVKESSDAFILYADVPGVVEKDIDISLVNNRLMITGQRQSEEEVKGEAYYRSERTWGSFSRSFTLPEGVEANKVTAELKNGVLIVQLPKTGEAKSKQIPVLAAKP